MRMKLILSRARKFYDLKARPNMPCTGRTIICNSQHTLLFKFQCRSDISNIGGNYNFFEHLEFTITIKKQEMCASQNKPVCINYQTV